MQIWSAEIEDIKILRESFKDQLPELEKEMEHLWLADDSNVILLYSRRCMEVIITDLCECELKRPRKTEPLKGIIDKLNKEDKVPSHIITSMESLNGLSTFGTHPKDYDPEQVRPVLILLATILKWYSKYKNIKIYQQREQKANNKEILSVKDEYSSNESGIILDYKGSINSDTIELIITKLRQSKDYENLNKNISNRIYAVLVECLENISRHSLKDSGNDELSDPYFSVRKQGTGAIIIAGNPVSDRIKNELARILDRISKLNEESLKLLYDEKISKELKDGEKSAGLGFIIMALKSGNSIKHSFRRTEGTNYFFEILISIAETSMKELIIEKTASSPKVILDCNKNIFEISGESRPNDPAEFYGRILKWLDDLYKHLESQKTCTEPIVFNMCFEYFNSSSAKYIHDVCKNLCKIRAGGNKLVVKWYYKEDDEDMLEAGKEISRLAKLPFENIQIKN